MADGLMRFNGTIWDSIMEIRLDPRMNKPEESALKDHIKKFEIKVTEPQLFTEKNNNQLKDASSGASIYTR